MCVCVGWGGGGGGGGKLESCVFQLLPGAFFNDMD